MIRASTYLILMAFFITLEVYRIPIAGYNITLYHIFLAGALFWGVLGVLQNRGRIRINKETRIALGILILFSTYSFVSFLRNVDVMQPESRSGFLAEMVGYIMVLSMAIFITRWKIFRQFVVAFLASGIFVYLFAFYSWFVWITRKEYLTSIPFWHTFSHSEHVIQYLQSPSEFMQFPRFTLPFSSPAGTGVFLSLSGIILLAFTLQQIIDKRRGNWKLILLNVINFFCLLGTFARASWAIYAVGSLLVIWSFRKYKLVSIGRVAMTYLIMVVVLVSAMSLIPIGHQFAHNITLRFSPRYTEQSNIGHLESRLLALHYWTERPVVGLGVGGFWLKPKGGIHTHSTYFTILVNRGLIGLILFLSILFSLYFLLKKRILFNLKSENKIAFIYGIALLGGLMGLCVGHFLYEMNSEVVWLYYGLILSYVNLRFPISEDKGPTYRDNK